MKSEIVESFSQMVKDKKMDRDILESIIKDVFGMMIKKKHGVNSNFEVIVNMDKGDIEMYLMKTVVDEIKEPETEIDIESASEKSGETLVAGDDYVEVLDFKNFGRRHIINLKQNLNQRIREIEKEIIYNDYKELLGEIIVGEIYQLKPNFILLIHNSHEIIFPKTDQIPKERYKKGESIRVYVKDVQKRQSGPPLIIVSRGSDEFLRKLFEQEIPEIYDGVIEIKSIAREPGERAKISVYSNDDRIDAVGACVGMKGIRIHSIVRELCNENIDVINFTEDIAVYISRALAPAKIKDIYLDKANKFAKIVADEDQISLIIGKNGQNIKLASKLTGFEIDVERKEKEKPALEIIQQDVVSEPDDEKETEIKDEQEVNNENITEEVPEEKKPKRKKKTDTTEKDDDSDKDKTENEKEINIKSDTEENPDGKKPRKKKKTSIEDNKADEAVEETGKGEISASEDNS